MILSQATSGPPSANPLPLIAVAVAVGIILIFYFRGRSNQKGKVLLDTAQDDSRTNNDSKNNSMNSKNSGFDPKQFAGFIAFLGIAISAYGLYSLNSNQPNPPPNPPAQFNQGSGIDGIVQHQENILDYQSQVERVNSINAEKQMNRETAKKILIGGGIVLFLGIAISASAKKSS